MVRVRSVVVGEERLRSGCWLGLEAWWWERKVEVRLLVRVRSLVVS